MKMIYRNMITQIIITWPPYIIPLAISTVFLRQGARCSSLKLGTSPPPWGNTRSRVTVKNQALNLFVKINYEPLNLREFRFNFDSIPINSTLIIRNIFFIFYDKHNLGHNLNVTFFRFLKSLRNPRKRM